MPNSAKDDLKSKFHVARIIYISAIALALVYVIVVNILIYYGDYSGDFKPGTGYDVFRYVMYGISLLMFFFIKYIRTLLISSKENPAEINHNLSPSTLLNITVVTAALCESVAIYALMLFIVYGRPLDFYILLILSLAYFKYFFPKYNQWEG